MYRSRTGRFLLIVKGGFSSFPSICLVYDELFTTKLTPYKLEKATDSSSDNKCVIPKINRGREILAKFTEKANLTPSSLFYFLRYKKH